MNSKTGTLNSKSDIFVNVLVLQSCFGTCAGLITCCLSHPNQSDLQIPSLGSSARLQDNFILACSPVDYHDLPLVSIHIHVRKTLIHFRVINDMEEVSYQK